MNYGTIVQRSSFVMISENRAPSTRRSCSPASGRFVQDERTGSTRTRLGLSAPILGGGNPNRLLDFPPPR